MKIQRYSSLDIYFLAIELNDILNGIPIHQVVVKGGDTYFRFADKILRYHIFSGSPYFIIDDNIPSGRNWLNPIIGGHIVRISQVAMDRIIIFEVAMFTKLGRRKSFQLYFEFFKNGNIVLTDDSSRVMSSLRRNFKSGQDYTIDKPEGFNILTIDEDNPLFPDDFENLRSLKVLRFSDMINRDPGQITKFIAKLKSGSIPHIIKSFENQAIGFTVYGPPFLDNLAGEKADSILEAVSAYIQAQTTAKKSKRPDYTKRLQKARKKLVAIEDELRQAGEYATFRLYGEIILANLKDIRKGQKECVLPNHSAEQTETVTISLDPSKNPESNARDYFNKARKLEKGLPVIKKRFEKQKAEVVKLQQLEDDFVDDKPKSQSDEARPGSTPKKPPFRNYLLEGGWQVYVGKSAASNDQLTFAFAKKDDLWFHAWQAFGSHLILRPPQKGAIPDKKIILQAASLAAYFSKARNSSKVPVIYTEVRYVRKVKKIVGKVTYTNEKGLMVKPLSPNEILS